MLEDLTERAKARDVPLNELVNHLLKKDIELIEAGRCPFGGLRFANPRHPELLKPCLRPALQGDTYRDLVQRSLHQDSAIERCNCKLEALRNEPPSTACQP